MKILTKLFLTVALGGALSATHAQVLYHTDFVGSNGSDPTNWLYVTDPYEQMNIQSNTFRIVRPSSGGARSNAVYNGLDNNGDSARSWADYTVLTRLQGSSFTVATSAIYGVMARFDDDPLEEQWGYTASILSDSITILKNDSSLQNQPGEVIGSQALSQSLSNNTWYWLEFQLEGSSLTATVYLDNAGNIGNSIGTATATNSDYSSGTAGVRAGFTASGSRSVSYDSFTVSAIPEPGVYAALLGLASLLVVVYIRRGR